MAIIKLQNSDKIVLVDDEDFQEVNQYLWKLSAQYARSFVWCPFSQKLIVVAMHRLIMRTPPMLTVDHRNLDKLDNRKENLRNCRFQENLWNRPKQKGNNSSQYKGVSIGKNGNWLSHITYNNVLYPLGEFTDEITAAIAYNNKAVQFYGEFANLNTI